MRQCIQLFTVLMLAYRPALAENVCSTHTIRGSWGVTCTGNVSPGAECAPLPNENSGSCTSTLEGVFTCEATMSLAGTIMSLTMVGNAVVNENCTGDIKYTQTVNGKPAPDMNIRFLIFDMGNSSRACRWTRARILPAR